LMNARRNKLAELIERARLAEKASGLSTGFIYSLLLLSDQAERDRPQTPQRRPEDALWRSRLFYRCARLVKDKTLAEALRNEVADALMKHRGSYRLPVSLLLYRQRK